MGERLVHDWLEGVDQNSEAFREFMKFCYEHFHGQMRLMQAAFAEANGSDLFREHLAEMEAGHDGAKADHMRDVEMDR